MRGGRAARAPSPGGLLVGLLLGLLPWGLAPVAEAQEEPKPDYVIALGSRDVAAAIEPLVAHRRAQGHVVRVLDPFSGREPWVAIPEIVAKLRPRYLLLVGDARALRPFVVAEAATDRPYADWDDDGYPDAAIGRLPSNDPAVVSRIVARTIATSAG